MASERRVTLQEVADLAGVSLATASKAMNDRPQVSAQSRAKVAAAVRQLGFRPNAVAQSLAFGRTGSVGLLTTDLEGRFSLPILTGAENSFGDDQISVLLSDARGDRRQEERQLAELLNRRVDGLIVVGRGADPRPSLGQELPVPVVYAYAPSDDPNDLSLVPDNEGAGRMVVEHLIWGGRTKIAHVSGNPASVAARDRAAGAASALAEHGMDFAATPLFGAWNEWWGREATAHLIKRGVEFDAVFAASDTIARGVLDQLRESGRRVPDDVAVVGFDNWELLVEHARPPLTSVDMNLEHLGKLGAQRLFEALEGKPSSGIELLPCRLVTRGSSSLASV